MESNGRREDLGERPLTIAMVVDSVGNQGNGTSNSALQWARELERQGHTVRLVGVGAPVYAAKIHHVPLASWVAAKQQMQFAEPDDALFRAAFDGVDGVHIYMPFAFGRRAAAVACRMGIPVTAGYHVQPENVLYSAGLLRFIPGLPHLIYRLFHHWLYQGIRHIHVPTDMTARLLRENGYHAKLHVISNGYSPQFTPRNVDAESGFEAGAETGEGHAEGYAGAHTEAHADSARDAGSEPFRIIASGRLTHEKDHITLIKAIVLSRHANEIELVIAGAGPLKRYLRIQSNRRLKRPASIGFHRNADMPELLRSGDLFVHCSIADIESISVIEAMACGLVPVIAVSDLSAASHFALLPQSTFPVRDPAALAQRIDWWIEHPEERTAWSQRYARHTKERYSVESSVKAFVAMEREAIADR